MIQIERALNKHLMDLNLGLPIIWQNTQSEPDIKKPYLEAFWVPSDTDPVSIGVGGFDEAVGFYQIDVKVPLETGSGLLTSYCGDIMEHYQNGTRLVYGGRSVLVLNQSLSPGTTEGTMYKRSITIYYSSMCQRRIL